MRVIEEENIRTANKLDRMHTIEEVNNRVLKEGNRKKIEESLSHLASIWKALFYFLLLNWYVGAIFDGSFGVFLFVVGLLVLIMYLYHNLCTAICKTKVFGLGSIEHEPEGSHLTKNQPLSFHGFSLSFERMFQSFHVRTFSSVIFLLFRLTVSFSCCIDGFVLFHWQYLFSYNIDRKWNGRITVLQFKFATLFNRSDCDLTSCLKNVVCSKGNSSLLFG